MRGLTDGVDTISRRRFIRTAASIVGITAMPGLHALNARAGEPRHFQVPEESGPHVRTFMQWPVNRTVYPDRVFLGMVQRSIAGIANAIAAFEPVIMLMDDKYKKSARRKLGKSIEIWDLPTDDLWCRDSGPLFVRDHTGKLAVSLLNFNGWGNKQVHKNDSKIARTVAQRLGLPVHENALVGEAGGVEADGDGTLIAHESSWVIDNRNPGSKADIERLLLQALGAEKLIWAPGIKGADITDYHIDSLARFVRPGTVLIQMPKKIYTNDPWSKAAFETYNILKNVVDAKGRELTLIVIPEPENPHITADDFVASYVNYYVCNGAVIAAQFGDKKADEQAKQILADQYPGRDIITLNIDPIGEIGGGIHCATQQQPVI